MAAGVVFRAVLGVSEGGKGRGQGRAGGGGRELSEVCPGVVAGWGCGNRSAKLACRCRRGITGCVTCILFHSYCIVAAYFASRHFGVLPIPNAVQATLLLPYLDASTEAGAQPLQNGRDTLSSFAKRI